MNNPLTRTCSNERKLFLILAFFLMSTLNFAQTFPSKFSGVRLTSNLDPVGMDITPDGRVFLAEKFGKISVFKNDVLLPKPLITIPNVDNFSERGLMEVLVDPDFAKNGFIYAFYTRKSGGVTSNRVSRYKVTGDEASVSSELLLIDIGTVNGTAGFHNGGGLAIVKGQLYISTGDSTAGENSQITSNLKGKILRINTDGTIPTDNPFFSTATGTNRAIWALGLRNPFKLASQNGTDKIFSTDVGDGSWEEINEIQKGKNYGWPKIEGKISGQTPPTNYKDPFHVYRTRADGACSITAGSFYNPQNTSYPASYLGKFFFGDYCAGWIKTINPANGAVENFATGISNPLDVAVNNSNGVLYFIARGSRDSNTSSDKGVLWKVIYTGDGIPVMGIQPSNTTVSIGQSVTFKSTASGTPTPTFQWQRNGANISGANANNFTIPSPTLADNGAKFKVRVSNSAGSVTSNEVTLTVLDNKIPEPTISTPVFGAKYVGGDVINFSGTALDKEDGDLPASAFTWKVDLFHFDDPDHFHPEVAEIRGVKSGSFKIPTAMETSPNVLFRIFLTVVDSKGSTKTITRDIAPIISKINLVTNPAGLKLKLDGAQVTSPFSFEGAKGINRSIEAVSPQTIGGVTYVFSSWSDKGAKEHTISTPDNGFTYTANFVKGTAVATGIVSGAIYEMEPQHLPAGQRLDVRGASTTNNTLVDMFQRNGNLNQQWKFISTSDNLFYIEPQNAKGKVLSVVGSSVAQNALIDIFDNKKQANQKWKAIPVEGESQLYRFEPQNALGKRLDIELLNGTQSAASRTLDDGRSQRWKLILVSNDKRNDNIGLDLNEENQFFAHPNPFNNKTRIALPAKNIKDAVKSIEIYNLQGQVLRVINVSSNESGDIIMERNNLESGVYIYTFKINDVELYSKKMIIVD
jgi:glucose/arabinose dehydrogenase